MTGLPTPTGLRSLLLGGALMVPLLVGTTALAAPSGAPAPEVEDAAPDRDDAAPDADDAAPDPARDAEGAAEADTDTLDGLDALRDEVRLLREELHALSDALHSGGVLGEPDSTDSEPEEEVVDTGRPGIDPSALKRRLRSQISGDRTTFAGDVRVSEEDVIGDAATMSGDIDVAGTVTGDAFTMNGTITVRDGGRVLGDASSLNGDVIVEPGGVLAGEAVTLNGRVEVMPGGQVLGTTSELQPHHTAMMAPHIDIQRGESWFSGVLSWLYSRFVFLLAFAGAGVLIIALFEERVAKIARVLEENPGKAGLVGLGWTVGLVVVGVATIFTILGPLAAIAVLGLAWLLGFVGLCQMLGDRLGLPLPYRHHGRWLAFLVGSVLVTFIGALPWIGFLVLFAASLFGIGAVFQSRFGSR